MKDPAKEKNVKPKRYTSDKNNHLWHLCHYWSRTTRKERVYKNAIKYTKMLCKALSSNVCCCSLKIRSSMCLMEAWITLESIQKCHAKLYHLTFVVAPLRLEVLRVLRKLEHKLLRKDYLQINAFLDLVMVEWEGYSYALKRKAIRGATSEVVREIAG